MNNYSTVFVGMDVHKETFTLCCYTTRKEMAEYIQRVDGNYTSILNYMEAMRVHYGDDVNYVCGYEAGCLGYSLYWDLVAKGVDCHILAPTTIPTKAGNKKKKTDKRDSATIARCLAHHDYSEVYVPTDHDNQVKEFIRMRDDINSELKKIKQQILALCLRLGYAYDGTKTPWTQAHLKWLHSLNLDGLYQKALDWYLVVYNQLTSNVEDIDTQIEKVSQEPAYKKNVDKLVCFKGIKTHTALSLIVETSDFNRFAKASLYAAYLGLTPGEHSSGEDQDYLGITKTGNSHLRRLLVETAHSLSRGYPGSKSKALKARQKGNLPEVIAYADKANLRLRKKFIRLRDMRGKKGNVARVAIAREMACFIWGMMTEHYD